MPAKRRRLTRQQSQEATRARLIEAAEKVFIRVGFDDASVEHITEAAGFSRGAFYSNFADKDALFLAVIDKRRLDVKNELDQILGSVTDPAERLDAVREWVTSLWRQKDWIALRLEFSRRAIRNRSVRKSLSDMWRQEVETYAGCISQYFAATGIAPVGRPELIALGLVAVCQGLGSLTTEAGPDWDDTYNEVASLVFDRLAASPR